MNNTTKNFNILEMIAEKRDGAVHDPKTINAFVDNCVAGKVADYQVSAWLMAAYLQGLNAGETAALTLAMRNSGDILDLSEFPHAVDKHSTGGVGDKTSLVLSPLLAVCGATVAKMSGRGLGHTGGTIDKLESISGFRTSLTSEEFLQQAKDIGVVITAQSANLAPADGLFYSLRDATATVSSVPLIASSIMSKKLAGGAQAMVLDVKVGSGAFMKTLESANELAKAMITIGKAAGKNVSALLTSMAEPLGCAVGNVLEVKEAIACLQGKGPADLQELVLALAHEILQQVGLPTSMETLEAHLTDGTAYDKFTAWVAAQGGDVTSLDQLAPTETTWTLTADKAGFITNIDALSIGQAVKFLGGGRTVKGAEIDMGVGVVLNKKVGDACEIGETLATVYHRDGKGLENVQKGLETSFSISDTSNANPNHSLILAHIK